MLSWLNRLKPQSKIHPKLDERWGNYKGEGIWWLCPDCDEPHEVTDREFLSQVEAACAAVSVTTHEMYDTFQMHAEGGRWDIAPENATFTKTLSDGRRAHGTYGLIGSWNEKTHSWLWSWEMDETWMPRPAIKAALALKELGDANGWDITAAKHVLVNEHETWHLTNLAAQVAGFPGTYRAKVNDLNHHYFILDDLKWESIQ